MMYRPNDLDDFLFRIRGQYPHQNTTPNPFFYLVKPTEENLVKYNLRGKNSRFRLILDFIFFLPLVSIALVKSLSIAIVRINESRSFHVEDNNESKSLIISHFTYAQKIEDGDIFFGSQEIFEENHTFYLNSTRLDGREIHQRFSKAGKLNQTINTKSLGFFQTIRIHFSQNALMFSIMRLALSKSSFSVDEKRLLLKAARWQHHRSTIGNLVLRERIRAVLKRIQPNEIVLTIEGHSHESMILDLRNSEFRDIKIVGVQHAPIVPGQFSFFRLISNFTELDVLLTSGVTPKNLVLDKVPHVSVKILGSPKSMTRKPSVVSSSKEMILGAVEGTTESLETFINLFNDLAPRLPQIRFVLRLHPAISDRESNRKLKKLGAFENLSVSKNTLFDDLCNSKMVIFRSSAVGIEGLAYSAIPIHYDPSGQNFLNPISNMKLGVAFFSKSQEIIDFIEGALRKENSRVLEIYDTFTLFNDYFSPLKNIKGLID